MQNTRHPILWWYKNHINWINMHWLGILRTYSGSDKLPFVFHRHSSFSWIFFFAARGKMQVSLICNLSNRTHKLISIVCHHQIQRFIIFQIYRLAFIAIYSWVECYEGWCIVIMAVTQALLMLLLSKSPLIVWKRALKTT